MILASGSPQRRAILEALGVEFEVVVTDVVEADEGPPAAVARENAMRKALAARGDEDRGPVLGVDTLVATGLEIWGKPPNEDAARETLRRLSGRTHDVISGFAVTGSRGEVTAGEELTRVTFRELDEPTIDWYVAAGEWDGRAGGYAIQGRGGALVQRIEGDYLNVVGLPVAAIAAACPGLLLP